MRSLVVKYADSKNQYTVNQNGEIGENGQNPGNQIIQEQKQEELYHQQQKQNHFYQQEQQ